MALPPVNAIEAMGTAGISGREAARGAGRRGTPLSADHSTVLSKIFENPGAGIRPSLGGGSGLLHFDVSF